MVGLISISKLEIQLLCFCCWKWFLLVFVQKSSVRYITLRLAGQKKRYSFLYVNAWIRTYSWPMDIYFHCWKWRLLNCFQLFTFLIFVIFILGSWLIQVWFFLCFFFFFFWYFQFIMLIVPPLFHLFLFLLYSLLSRYSSWYCYFFFSLNNSFY